MKGITLLALGSVHYGYFAYNMALSIRANSDVKIQLVHDKQAISGMSNYQLKIFDILTPMHYEHYHRKKLEPGLAKIHLYDYLHFDETIYLDVDGICIGDITELFKHKCNFATQVFDEVKKEDGLHKNMKWQTTEKIWERFKLKDDAILPATNTSFMLIRKSKEAAKIFQDAQNAIANSWEWNELALRWGRTTSQPDELYFNISLAMNGFERVGEPILFTTPSTPNMPLREIKEKYKVIGYYGDEALNAKFVRILYDKIISAYSKEYLKCHQQFKFHQLIKNKFLLKNV